MSGRGGQRASEPGERRGSGGHRVHFEALVAVGASGGGGFEAESVDVSPDGMRLRAAHVPDVGDRLLCRFDGFGGELSVEGEVCWRNEEARGGEFGLRFVDLDAASEQAVRAMCAGLGDAPAGQGADGPPAATDAAALGRGTRVRLHIEGLGSPMKARVRDTGAGNVEVGSNLEFLKVGRSIELEDVDRAARRDAYIDEVKVEVDPSTSIPQLVVTLRYEGQIVGATKDRPTVQSAAKPHAPRSVEEDQGADPPGHTAMLAGGGSTEDSIQGNGAADADDAPDSVSARPSAAEAANDDDSPAPGDTRAARGAAAIRDLGGKAARAGASVAGKVGPTLAGVGARARGAMAGLFARIQEKRAERAAQAKTTGPRRMTAPPPGGALRADGRRLVRGDDDADAPSDLPPKPGVNKRAAAIGSFLGLAAVLAVFGAARFWGFHAGAPAAQAPAPGSTSAPALPPADTAVAAAPGAPLSAEVPLFGGTPLSTTEPVPPNAPAAPAAQDPAVAAADAEGAAPAADPSGDAPADDDGDPKAWGQGSVKHPVVLKLKMDGPIDELNGASGAMGFTVSLPDRRALSSGTDLARKDKRIASLRVVNTPHGAEVTLQFKDGVPAYLAKANGNRLEIALGNEHPTKKVASKSKKSTSADKGKAQKKSAKKKPAAKN